MSSTTWRDSYPMARILHLEDYGSDHCPLLLDSSPLIHQKKRRFKFQERWSNLKDVRKIVAFVWSTRIEGSPMYQHFQRLKSCRHELVTWQKTNNSNSAAKIKLLRETLAAMKEMEGHQDKTEFLRLEQELTEAYQQEERYWKEKSRISWLRWGDQNTRFFHAKTNARHRKNKIWRLESREGQWCTGTENIGAEATNFFVELFSSSHPSNPAELLTGLRKKVSNTMNRNLTRPVSEQEVKRAIFSINPLGAPGDDGFTAKFYQSY